MVLAIFEINYRILAVSEKKAGVPRLFNQLYIQLVTPVLSFEDKKSLRLPSNLQPMKKFYANILQKMIVLLLGLSCLG